MAAGGTVQEKLQGKLFILYEEEFFLVSNSLGAGAVWELRLKVSMSIKFLLNFPEVKRKTFLFNYIKITINNN